MSILDRLLALFAPYDCLDCGAEGALLCLNCQQKLSQPLPQCYRCRQLSPDWLTCADCEEQSPLYSVQACTVYQGAAKTLVWQLKSNGAQAAASLMVHLIQSRLSPEAGTLIVPVPTATNRIRRRGYDQAQLLARELSHRTGLPLANFLVRQRHADQIGATRELRRSQQADAFWVRRPDRLQGAHIILVDDVVTTGATLEAAARTLHAAGVTRIEALVFAQPTLRNLQNKKHF
jgi:ComF family protein